MPYKTVEVKHYLVTGNIEFLNTFVADKLSEGWELLDCKIGNFDKVNADFTVLYIFVSKTK